MNVPVIIRKNWLLILFLVLLAAFRFSLITKGHFFDADERRYLYALWSWKYILHGHFFKGLSCLFEVQGRPGFVLINLFPAALQIIFAHFHLISTVNMHFFDIPSFFNVLVTLINSVIFYGILMLILSDRYLALIGTAVYSLLVNSNGYIRHLFPYDYSLLFFLLAIFLILKQGSSRFPDVRIPVVCGILCAWAALIYPGYYSLALIVTVFLAFSNQFDLKILGFYFGGFLLVIFAFELFSELLRKSYFLECMVVADTVKHGSFAEGFLFITRYLSGVEGLIGIVLFLLFLIYSIFFLVKDQGPCRWLVLPAILMYSFHAILGVFFSKMVFYGRSLHMYFPFLVIAALRLLSLIPRQSYKKAAGIILLVVAVVSFVPWARIYSRLTYPRDIYFKYLSQVPENKVLWLLSGDKVNLSDYKNYSAVVLNLRSFFDVKENYTDPVPVVNMVMVTFEPHPLNFPSYTFENYGPHEREVLRERKYQMKIYLAPQARKNLENPKASQYLLSSFLYKTAESW